MWVIVGNRLLVEADATERRHGNIVIPETAYDTHRYIVVAVGTGDEVQRIRPGQRVVLVRPMTVADEVVLDGRRLYVADYRDILAVEVGDEAGVA